MTHMFHENKTNIPGISATVFDITVTASVWSQLLYQFLQNNYGSHHTSHRMTSYTPYITSDSDFMTSIVSI